MPEGVAREKGKAEEVQGREGFQWEATSTRHWVRTEGMPFGPRAGRLWVLKLHTEGARILVGGGMEVTSVAQGDLSCWI